ncbi:hypothetical protein HRR83_002653 [Exophiala dermatitidis]|uniref:Uncharacterized protein n=1 Tax=Exophiala dermatitidis TaxID=5970 RepID=A0AAN6EM34_EXODE|nr:hypothetical protein HRR74_009272 [Exophiala dermatitidis]KAJ4514567.1 hypothetical protein HRR73_005595 [Exophiala dermatitidis]KAJ4531815.1 hypothetical protein HRR77_009090 [Exophiala dermatitidis]KAJ4537425.1 hypothetical protein HRR76_005429 [Exophiala dermatitidis]KAJ4566175.1 hypothetical protein HRR79_005197 [Exophiala dermatitidis]
MALSCNKQGSDTASRASSSSSYNASEDEDEDRPRPRRPDSDELRIKQPRFIDIHTLLLTTMAAKMKSPVYLNNHSHPSALGIALCPLRVLEPIVTPQPSRAL